MLVIIQVSHADAHLMPVMGELLTKFGPYKNHRVLIAYTQDVSAADVQKLRHQLEPIFSVAQAREIKTTSSKWPLACNQAFKEVAAIAAEIGETWLNLELDCTPMRSGWLDEIVEEYKAAGKPFMGAVVPTRGFISMADGSKQPLTNGHHLVGWAIYPPEFARVSVKLPSVATVMMWGADNLEPYDIQLRHETINAHNSHLFQHSLRTVNYRLNEDKTQIVCDNTPGNSADHANPVDPRAAIVHGCKDGSLSKLILSGTEVPKTIPVSTPSQEGASPRANGEGVSTSKPPRRSGQGGTTSQFQSSSDPHTAQGWQGSPGGSSRSRVGLV